MLTPTDLRLLYHIAQTGIVEHSKSLPALARKRFLADKLIKVGTVNFAGISVPGYVITCEGLEAPHTQSPVHIPF